MEMWSNQACLGYAIAAMERKGYTAEQIKEVVRSMQFVFDNKSIEQAAEIYRQSS